MSLGLARGRPPTRRAIPGGRNAGRVSISGARYQQGLQVATARRRDAPRRSAAGIAVGWRLVSMQRADRRPWNFLILFTSRLIPAVRMIASSPIPNPSCRPRPSQGQAPAGIHDFICCDEGKSWMPTFVGMTVRAQPVGQSFRRLVLASCDSIVLARRLIVGRALSPDRSADPGKQAARDRASRTVRS